MKTLVSFFLFAVIASSSVFGQTSLSGKITDGDTGEELIAANVTIYKDGVFITGIATDFEGNYSINLDPGTYDVEVSYIGYGPVKTIGVVVRAGQKNLLNTFLGNAPPQGRRRANLNIRRQQRQAKSDDIEFHSPKREGLIREVLDNSPVGNE